MAMHWTMRLILALILIAGVASAQPAPRRVALVIGNGAYQMPAWRLANPARDAALLARKLRALGFEVDQVTDATRTTMESAFERFGARLKAGGADTVGFFFSAGHGAQKDSVNYLVPVDANATTSDRLRYQSPALTFLLDDMAEAGNAVNIIVLDACRDMPLADGARSVGRGGLADVGRLPNVFIAYATAPGRTAADGGGANSPFTTTLAAALDTQAGEPLALLFDDVNARVYASTDGAQSPEYRNGLVRAPRWSLASASASGPSARTAPAAAGPPAENWILGQWVADLPCATNTRFKFERVDGGIGQFLEVGPGPPRTTASTAVWPSRPWQKLNSFDPDLGVWRGPLDSRFTRDNDVLRVRQGPTECTFRRER
jgi:hypothetical protein